jgi:uncharacterized protein
MIVPRWASTVHLWILEPLKFFFVPSRKGRSKFDPIAGELISRSAALAFPIRNSIPILLADEARKIDR